MFCIKHAAKSAHYLVVVLWGHFNNLLFSSNLPKFAFSFRPDCSNVFEEDCFIVINDKVYNNLGDLDQKSMLKIFTQWLGHFLTSFQRFTFHQCSNVRIFIFDLNHELIWEPMFFLISILCDLLPVYEFVSDIFPYVFDIFRYEK